MIIEINMTRVYLLKTEHRHVSHKEKKKSPPEIISHRHRLITLRWSGQRRLYRDDYTI